LAPASSIDTPAFAENFGATGDLNILALYRSEDSQPDPAIALLTDNRAINQSLFCHVK